MHPICLWRFECVLPRVSGTLVGVSRNRLDSSSSVRWVEWPGQGRLGHPLAGWCVQLRYDSCRLRPGPVRESLVLLAAASAFRHISSRSAHPSLYHVSGVSLGANSIVLAVPVTLDSSRLNVEVKAIF